MPRTLGCVSLCLVTSVLSVACVGVDNVDHPIHRPMAVLVKTSDKMRIDGRLDEPVWSDCPAYDLARSRQDRSTGACLQEPGTVRFAHDDEWLYVGIRFEDSDVVAEGDRDQLHHYELGDVAELFIKPADRSWYWEMYVTSAGLKSAFFIPGRGRLPLPSNFKYQSALRVGAQIEGTVNNWRDRDEGWTAEMAIPLDELSVEGHGIAPDQLTVLLARYNYSRYLDQRELSSWPQLDRTDFHRYEAYATLNNRKAQH